MARDLASLDWLSHVDEANEILKRLTVKKLCLMSAVSATWKNLIYDAYFKTLHLEWSKKNPLMLVVTPPLLTHQDYILSDDEYGVLADQFYGDGGLVGEDDVQYPLVLTSLNPTSGDVIYRVMIDISAEFEVLSSGRGCLFCIHSSERYVIFNATTKQIQDLPEADPPYATAVGFGYIEARNAYVIVHLCYGSCQLLMLSETGEMLAPWRTIEGASPFNISGSACTFVGNTCYWMDDPDFYSPSSNYILGLDIDSEMFYTIDYPAPESCENGHHMHIGELNNLLFLTDTSPRTLKMDIWVRGNGENAEWEIKYGIDLSMIEDFNGIYSMLKLIGYVEGDQDEEPVLIFQDSELYDQVLYYDIKARRFEIGKTFQVEDNPGNMMFPYSERINSIRRPETI